MASNKGVKLVGPEGDEVVADTAAGETKLRWNGYVDADAPKAVRPRRPSARANRKTEKRNTSDSAAAAVAPVTPKDAS